MTDTFEANSRPSFRERVLALAGHTTWREPTGAGTSHLRAIPSDHLIAAALSFGRAGPRDFGPDVAIDIATGVAGHWQPVCERLGALLASADERACRRVAPYAAHAAVAAYNAVVRGWMVPEPPGKLRRDDWGQVVVFGCLLLERSAEDALQRAARKHRRVA